MASPSKLTARQRVFVREYARTRNAVQSYFKAYGRHVVHGGREVPRSYKAASVQSSRLLEKPNILAELAAAEAVAAATCNTDYQRFLDEQVALAYSDISDAFRPNPDGGYDLPVPLSMLDPLVRRCVKSVEVDIRRESDPDGGPTIRQIERVKVTMHDKGKAQDSLSKHLGFCRDRDPLESVLALLPADVAAAVRLKLAAAVKGS